MLPDRVSNQGPPIYESGALPIALRGPARNIVRCSTVRYVCAAEVLKLHCSTVRLNNIVVLNYR